MDEDWIFVEAEAPDEPVRVPAAVAWQCMSIAGFLWSCAYTLVVFLSVELVSVHYEQIERGVALTTGFEATTGRIMPNAWEKRLVQTSATFGQEVALLRKSQETGYWLVATPTEGICKLKLADRASVRTGGAGVFENSPCDKLLGAKL